MRGKETSTPARAEYVSALTYSRRPCAADQKGANPNTGIRIDWSYDDNELIKRATLDATLDMRALRLRIAYGVMDFSRPNDDTSECGHTMTVDARRGGSLTLAGNFVQVYMGHEGSLPAGLTYPPVAVRVSASDASPSCRVSQTIYIGDLAANTPSAITLIPERAIEVAVQNESSIVAAGLVVQYGLNKTDIISSELVTKDSPVPIRQGAMYFTLTFATVVAQAAAQFTITA